MTVTDDVDAYYDDTVLLQRQAVAMVLRLWNSAKADDITGSWARFVPQAIAILVGADTVAAELADPYLTQVVDDNGPPRVSVDGMVQAGLEELLYMPTIRAKTLIAQGVAANVAMLRAGRALAMYAHTRVGDTARLAVAAGMAARPHVGGYYRKLRPPSCSRCAILAGRFYRWNDGFRRHPRCDCVHIPMAEADDSLAYDPRGAIEAGHVTGLSKRDLEAIRLGADPSQVVNAAKGTYEMGEFAFTRTGTTRRGVAGARILAKDVDRARGVDVSRNTYTNYTFDRHEAAKYAELFRRGKTYTRLTRTGRVQQYAYRFVRTPRPTPSQIITSAGSRTEAIRLLTNYGYIL